MGSVSAERAALARNVRNADHARFARVEYQRTRWYNFCAGMSVDDATRSTLDLAVPRSRVCRAWSWACRSCTPDLPCRDINAEQKDPTPARVTVWGSVRAWPRLTRDTAVSLWLSGDMVARLRSFGSTTATADSIAGARAAGRPRSTSAPSWAFDQTIFVRAGYAMSRGRSGRWRRRHWYWHPLRAIHDCGRKSFGTTRFRKASHFKFPSASRSDPLCAERSLLLSRRSR